MSFSRRSSQLRTRGSSPAPRCMCRLVTHAPAFFVNGVILFGLSSPTSIFPFEPHETFYEHEGKGQEESGTTARREREQLTPPVWGNLVQVSSFLLGLLSSVAPEQVTAPVLGICGKA